MLVIYVPQCVCDLLNKQRIHICFLQVLVIIYWVNIWENKYYNNWYEKLIFFSSLEKALSAQSLHTCNSMASEVIEKKQESDSFGDKYCDVLHLEKSHEVVNSI